MSQPSLQTEFEFTLPRGYVDDEGTVHRDGRMRLATAADEIKPLNDPRVQENASYLTVLLLSRVTTQIGTVDEVSPDVVESLFVPDLEYLQELYERINDGRTDFEDVTVPDDETADSTSSIEPDEPLNVDQGEKTTAEEDSEPGNS
ncbi:hypothetical protein [Natrarchaeobius halalkaliphilus]|uniref:hypothetical protein n=1 Tax=Natrarchaeobius halalkaliphilus TaxID=1679091 RepID=UPI001A9E1D3D